MNTTARKARSSIAVAGTGVLLAAAVLALAPVASAAPADSGPPSLAVSTAAPAEIGAAGQSVPFTTTVTNTGPNDTSFVRLIYRIDATTGVMPDAVSLQYRLGGTAWHQVPLTYADDVFSGEVPQTFPLAAGASRTVQMRLGMPMGTPHNGDSNGGTRQVKMTTMVSYGASGAAIGEDHDTVKVDGLSTALSGVPRTAVAGGPPVTFTASVTNPSNSAYTNVTDVLFTNRHTSVQVLRSGHWTTLKPLTSTAEPDVYGYDVIGKDASMAPHSRTTVTVRLTYRKDAPLGATTVNPCAIVNEGSGEPFRGSTDCGAFTTITVKAPGSSSTPSSPGTPSSPASPSTTPTPTATASGTTSGTTSGTGSTSGTTAGDGSALARTGSGGTTTAAAVGGAFVLAGAGAVGYVALRRRRTGA